MTSELCKNNLVFGPGIRFRVSVNRYTEYSGRKRTVAKLQMNPLSFKDRDGRKWTVQLQGTSGCFNTKLSEQRYYSYCEKITISCENIRNSFKVYFDAFLLCNEISYCVSSVSHVYSASDFVHSCYDVPCAIEEAKLGYGSFQVQITMLLDYSTTDREVSTDPLLGFEGIAALSSDYQRLQESGLFTDVRLCIGDDELKVHSTVLCARSLVFARMFEEEKQSSNDLCIQVTDVEFPALQSFVHYLYTGQIANLSNDTAYDLYKCAAKYRVMCLKTTCSRYLASKLETTNSIRVLVLADMNGDDALKIAAKEYICGHFSEISNSVGWNELLEQKPALATETLQLFTKKIAGESVSVEL